LEIKKWQASGEEDQRKLQYIKHIQDLFKNEMGVFSHEDKPDGITARIFFLISRIS